MKTWLWRVRLPGRGEVEIEAESREAATVGAAKLLRVHWASAVRDMDVTRKGEPLFKRCARCGQEMSQRTPGTTCLVCLRRDELRRTEGAKLDWIRRQSERRARGRESEG